MLMWAKNGNRTAQERRRVPNAFNGADRVLERRDAVIDEACRTAPHHDVTVFGCRRRRIGTAVAAPQEIGR
jgi:hypothetical protein